MKPKTYKKIPGRGMRKGFFVASVPTVQLWLGEDHLLLTETAGLFEERYKRFYLKDIRAITTSKTKSGYMTNIYMGILCLIFASGFLINNTPLRVIAGILFAFPFITLIVNTIKGPTSETRILTAVQNEELPSMNRVRAAEKALTIITPLIQEAQAKSEAADVFSSESGFQESAESEPASPTPSPTPENPPVT